MQFKALIIDDERAGREIIKTYLSSYPGISVLGECTNGFEGLKLIQELKPDLIFLDIQMPKITGFEMLELLDEPPIVIFTTAYDEYAIKAFEVSAADYLLKPFSEERFNSAVERALKLTPGKAVNDSVRNVLINQTGKGYLQRIVVKTGNKITVIPAEEIRWIEAQDDYVMIHSKEGKFLKQKTMASLEMGLDPDDFVRVHRSYIIRISELKKIILMEKESYKVVLNDDTSLAVSKSGYIKLKEVLK